MNLEMVTFWFVQGTVPHDCVPDGNQIEFFWDSLGWNKELKLIVICGIKVYMFHYGRKILSLRDHSVCDREDRDRKTWATKIDINLSSKI